MLARAVRAVGDQQHDLLEYLSQYRDFGHFKGRVSGVARHLRRNLEPR
jgi:hypothetical protein